VAHQELYRGLQINSELGASLLSSEQSVYGLRPQRDTKPRAELAAVGSQRSELVENILLKTETTDVTNNSPDSFLTPFQLKREAGSELPRGSHVPRNAEIFSGFNSSGPPETIVIHKRVKLQHTSCASSQERFGPPMNDQTDTNYGLSGQNHVVSSTTHSRKIYDRKGKGTAESDTELVVDRRDLEIIGNGESTLGLEELTVSSGRHAI
jgi:hypothetical protein